MALGANKYGPRESDLEMDMDERGVFKDEAFLLEEVRTY